MNGKNMGLIKSTKTYTLILAIVFTIMSVVSLLGSFGLMVSQNIDYSQMEGITKEQAEVLSGAVTPAILYATYAITLISIVLTVFLYIYNVKLKNGNMVNKIPYFGVAALQIYSLVQGVMGVISSGVGTNLISLAINVAILVLAVLALMNLFKLDNEKSA